MPIKRQIGVILFCTVTPFLAPLSALAQQDSVTSFIGVLGRKQALSKEVMENIRQWKHQENQALTNVDPHKEFLQKDLRMQKLRSMRGGPGMDGGGGDAVLSQTGLVRFLDLAKAEGTPIKNFDKEAYEKQLLKFDDEVSSVGRVVPTNDFFSCGIELFQRQNNPLLKTLPKILNLQVVLSNLPLEATAQGLLKIPFLGSSGWTYEMSSLPPEILMSPSLPLEMQRPVASYANQSVNGASGSLMKSRTLLVNSQLYQLMPNQDRCALQVHEMLRFFSHTGGGQSPDFLRRTFTTQEIEALTVRITRQEPVSINEIPATNLFRTLAIAGIQPLLEMSQEELVALDEALREQGITDKVELSSGLYPGEATMIFRTQISAEKNITRTEEAILAVGQKNPFSGAGALKREMDKMLRSYPVKIREIMRSLD
jgi:hypothetical protein